MPIVKIDSSFIANQLICPAGKGRIEYVCADQSPPGFYAEVRATSPGECTYYLRYKDPNGVTRHVKIGRSKEISLAEARKKAKEIKSSIVLGADPRGEEQKRKAVLTFNQFFEDHALPYFKQHKRSWVRDEMLWRLRIKPGLGTKRMTDITTKDLVDLQAQLAEEGLAAASVNHHHRLIGRCFTLSRLWGGDLSNPASRFKLLFEDNKIDHRMNEQQLESFLQVLRTDHNKMVCAIALFLLATGLRTQEALSLTWSNVDIKHRQIIVTASNSKSRRQRIVPTSDVALEVLNQMERSEASEYVFVNKKTRTKYTTIYKVFVRLRKKAGLPKLRVHSLRGNFASLCLNAGVSVYTIKSLLGHAQIRTTERYLTLSEQTLSDATNTLAGIIQQASAKSLEANSEVEQQPASEAGAEGGPVTQPEAA